VIANIEGFGTKNLDLAKYPKGVNPLKDGSLDKYKVYEVDVTKLTRACLEGSGLGVKDIDRSKKYVRAWISFCGCITAAWIRHLVF